MKLAKNTTMSPEIISSISGLCVFDSQTGPRFYSKIPWCSPLKKTVAVSLISIILVLNKGLLLNKHEFE